MNNDSGTNNNNANSDKGCNVQVIVRCRPQNDSEKKAMESVCVVTAGNEVSVFNNKLNANTKNNKRTFTYDKVVPQTANQSDIYQCVQPLVEEVLAGFNCTVFAYGQTGTGKTYTMEGDMAADSPHAGVIPRAVHTIFQRLKEVDIESSVKISFLELYNEELSDLLSDDGSFNNINNNNGSGEEKQLRIFEDSSGKKGTHVAGLEEIIVNQPKEVFHWLQKGFQRRQVAETQMNKNSSRSHCVFTITVHTKEVSTDGEDIFKTGKLYLVDLAGSECIGRSGAQNQRAKEAGKINQSLLTLGRVINALVEKQAYVPYRDSKLTRLLQESLGGRAKTVIIATISPSSASVDETLSTLDYAQRAKHIKNKPQVNQKMTKRTYIKDLLAEISQLKRDNDIQRSKNGVYLDPERYAEMNTDIQCKTAQIEELNAALLAKEDQRALIAADLERVTQEYIEMKASRDDFQAKYKSTAAELSSTRSLLNQMHNRLTATETCLSRTQSKLLDQTRQLERTSYLLNARIQTEKTLQQEAAAVKSTLEGIVVEKDTLVEKVNQLSQLLKTNDEAAHRVSEALQNQLKSAHSSIEQFIKGAVDTNASLSSAFDEIRSSTDTAINSVNSAAHEGSNAFIDAASRMKQSTDAQIHHCHATVEERVRQTIVHANEIVASLSSAREMLSGHASDYDARSERTMQLLSYFSSSIESRLQKSFDAAQSFNDTVIQRLADTSKANDAAQSMTASAIESSAQNFSSFVNRFKTDAEITNKSLLESFASMIRTAQQQQFAALQAAGAQLSEQLQGAVQSTHRATKENAGSLSSISNDLSQWKRVIADGLRDDLSAISAGSQSVNEQLSAMRSDVSQMVNASRSHSNKLAEKIETEREAVEARKIDDVTAIALVERTIAQSVEETSSLSSQLTSSIAAPLKVHAHESHTIITDAQNTLKQSSNNANEEGVSHQSSTESMRNAVLSYEQSEIQREKCSGSTPRKRKVSIPASFTKTAADNELINKFEAATPMPSIESLAPVMIVDDSLHKAFEQLPPFDDLSSASLLSEPYAASEIRASSPIESLSVPPTPIISEDINDENQPNDESYNNTPKEGLRVHAKKSSGSLLQPLSVEVSADKDPSVPPSKIPTPSNSGGSVKGSARGKAGLKSSLPQPTPINL